MPTAPLVGSTRAVRLLDPTGLQVPLQFGQPFEIVQAAELTDLVWIVHASLLDARCHRDDTQQRRLQVGERGDAARPCRQHAPDPARHACRLRRPLRLGLRRREVGQNTARLVGVAGQDLQVDGKGAGVRQQVAAHRKADVRRLQQGLGDRREAAVVAGEDGHQVVGGVVASGLGGGQMLDSSTPQSSQCVKPGTYSAWH